MDYSGDLWTRPRITGDWGGTRTELAEKGLTFDVNWTQYVQGVAAGGRSRGAEYGGALDYLAKIDLMRMGVVAGGLVTLRAETRYGSSVNGNTGALNAVEVAPNWYIIDDDYPQEAAPAAQVDAWRMTPRECRCSGVRRGGRPRKIWPARGTAAASTFASQPALLGPVAEPGPIKDCK